MAALGALLVLCAAPAPASLAAPKPMLEAPRGLFYPKEFAAWLKSDAFEPHAMGEAVAQSLAFGADGGVVIQAEGFAGTERTCQIEAQPSEGALVLQLVCGDPAQPMTRRWRWRSGDEAETDVFSETDGGSTEVVVRAKPTWEEREKAYADAFHRARLPALVGRYAGADGTVVEIDGKGLARVGGRRVEARIVECVSADRPEHGQTGCLLLAPQGDVGQAGEWLIRPEGKALTLVQGLQAFETRNGVWPGGFEVVDGGQVLKRTR